MGKWPMLKVEPGKAESLDKCSGIVEACAEDLLRVEQLPEKCVVLVKSCGA